MVRASPLGLALVVALTAPRSARADEALTVAPAPVESWATARARELVRQGDEHRGAGRVALALARYREALEMDATYAPAYLALAELREASGEIEEAERVLALGLDRVPGFWEAKLARARILARAARAREATSVLLSALDDRPDDPVVLGKLLEVAPRAGQLPVALASARRLVALARARGDAAAERDAGLSVVALSPVTSSLM